MSYISGMPVVIRAEADIHTSRGQLCERSYCGSVTEQDRFVAIGHFKGARKNWCGFAFSVFSIDVAT